MTALEKTHADRLAALGSPARLAAVRLLVRAGDEGMTVGDMQRRLEMPASTMAHHVSSLVQTGLVRQTRRGREVWCAVDFAVLRATAAFLTEACCEGLAPLVEAADAA